MNPQTNDAQSGGTKQLAWIAGAIGAAAGVAVWAYSRREPSYWEKTKRTAGKVADAAADMNPWWGVAAGTAALGGAALAYRGSRRKSPWERASARANEFAAETGKQLRPWAAIITSAALSVASAAYNAKTRRRFKHAAVDRAATAADQFVDSSARLWRRIQNISGEAAGMYPRVRRLIA